MAVAAIINGVSVSSDKTVKEIRNSRITFTDGSWCDVSTGEVVNKGHGYINLGGREAEGGEKTTWGPRLFPTKALEVRKVSADVEVEVHNEPNISVTVTGPIKEVEAIKAEPRGNTLFVEGSTHPERSRFFTGRRGVSLIGSSIRMTTSGGSIVVGGLGGEHATKIHIKVPPGVPVTLYSVDGDVRIGDTDGPLTVHLLGAHDVSAGRVGETSLDLRGSGDITVDHVTGDLTIRIQGAGDVDVAGGAIDHLQVQVSGSGDVNVRGTAETASLTMSGAGDITVSRVLQEPKRSNRGSGDIRVRRVG